MRRAGKGMFVLGLAVLWGCLMAVGQSASGSSSTAKGKTVHKAGRVEAGVEGGCLLVRDTRDYKLYHVLFGKGAKPKAGEEISFRGTLHDGPTTCMEGIPVDVSAWKPIPPSGGKAK